MIPVSLSPLFNDLFNHLWQSTLFAGVAALLALTLTRNHARARHWLWLSASVKFLIPFSLLVTMGSHIAWPTATPIAQPRVSLLMQEVSQPFTAPVTPSAPAPTPASPLPALLFVLWACGLIAVALSWYLRWRAFTRSCAQLHHWLSKQKSKSCPLQHYSSQVFSASFAQCCCCPRA